MDKIIFLDIDGVLNTTHSFQENWNYKKLYNAIYSIDNIKYLAKKQLIDIDFNNLQNLIHIITKTNAKVVITSAWCKLKIYPFIESYLIKSGIPVVDYIQSFSDRGERIQEYIQNNNIEKFIILDDSVFKGYYPIIDRLIWTNFYDGGLTYELANDAIYKLR